MRNEGKLRAAYQELLESRRERHGDACVSPEAILALVERRGEESDRLRTLDHVMACTHCMEEFELLRGLADSDPGSTAGTGRKRPTLARTGTLAWAASLVLALGVGSLWWMAREGPSPGRVMRGTGSRLELISPEPGARPADEITFRWHSVPGTFEYTLEVVGTDGSLHFQAVTPDTSLTADPAEIGASGAELRWWVRGRTTEGSTVQSVLRPLTLRDP